MGLRNRKRFICWFYWSLINRFRSLCWLIGFFCGWRRRWLVFWLLWCWCLIWLLCRLWLVLYYMLQYWGLLVNVNRRMTSIYDMWSRRIGFIRYFTLCRCRSWFIVGSFWWWFVLGLWLVNRFGRTKCWCWWGIGSLRRGICSLGGRRGLVGCLSSCRSSRCSIDWVWSIYFNRTRRRRSWNINWLTHSWCIAWIRRRWLFVSRLQ